MEYYKLVIDVLQMFKKVVNEKKMLRGGAEITVSVRTNLTFYFCA